MDAWRIDAGAQTLVIGAEDSLPFVVYWGAALPQDQDLATLVLAHKRDVGGGMLDQPAPLSLSPQTQTGFQGHPGLVAHHLDGTPFTAQWITPTVEQAPDALTLTSKGTYEKGEASLSFIFQAYPDTGIITAQSSFKLDTPLHVSWLSAPVLRAPAHLSHYTDLSGRWRDEFQLNTAPWSMGQHVRENRTGRTDHMHFPGLLLHGADRKNTSGACYGLHLGWSGGHKMVLEQLQDGRRQIQFGQMPDDSLNAVTSMTTPQLYLAYGAHGLNDVARCFQAHVRTHILRFPDPEQPRPIHYNCWEAVYFKHDLDELKSLATQAAALGAERFVLDDGWFGKRDDDTTSLGDWHVAHDKYPDGLTPLIQHIQSCGMTFGIWVEPEMVNMDSDLYRAHPDWLLGPKDQSPGRQQYVLNLALPEVQEYVFRVLSKLLTDHDITYVKWDHNRILPFVDARQTQGFYGLMDRLTAAHPTVEFESCASGGGRIDFEVLSRMPRVWLSDSNDALERVRIQHDAALFLPSVVVGSHVGPRDCHTSHRVLPISFRAWVAAQRHMGMEMDPRELTDEEADSLKTVFAWWKANRSWLRTADTLRLDTHAPGVTGEIHIGQTQFVAFIAILESPKTTLPDPIFLTGLDPNASYQVSARSSQNTPSWSFGTTALPTKTLDMTGAALMQMGLNLPQSFPATLWIIEGTRRHG